MLRCALVHGKDRLNGRRKLSEGYSVQREIARFGPRQDTIGDPTRYVEPCYSPSRTPKHRSLKKTDIWARSSSWDDVVLILNRDTFRLVGRLALLRKLASQIRHPPESLLPGDDLPYD